VKCPLCGGTGEAQANQPEPPVAETEQKAIALITLALDHCLHDDQAFSLEELFAVAGDTPLQDVLPLLATVTTVTAYILRNTAADDDAAREWWQAIAQHYLAED
jgi:hypothetical protein